MERIRHLMLCPNDMKQTLGVESYNTVMDESNNLGFLQVYSLTQLIQGL